MDLLTLIAEKYGFRELRWVRQPEVIMTHVGKRKVSYWRERDLLEYHLNFRDRLFFTSGFLCNRMIRTLNQEAFIPIHHGFLTVHDFVEDEFSYEQSPEMEGCLLSSLVRCGIGIEQNDYAFSPFPYRDTIKSLFAIKSLYPESYLLLISLIPDVKKRLCYHKDIVNGMIPFSSHSIKEVMGQLYFESSNEAPISVSEALSDEVYLWYERKTRADFTHCFKALLSEVDQELRSTLIQTIVAPWEWLTCIQSLQYEGSKVDRVMKEFVEKWEAMKEITGLVELSILEGRVAVHE
ncbi:hypothetical protein [Bacillus sp. RAR_GA_16]|uniref:hypothetical protein n=1 Tax=Bacillus sp. RAR_GA_16 TaxID=2876774 RepID=UPI001CCF7B5F|nr:hypothetical protein [Bacillus sp. RAR_GA_16]MCA0171688.1 hypothetical protein [Bacillus sp. RAR_GA_16]